MKTWKIEIYLATGQEGETTFTDLGDAVAEYDRLYALFKNEPDFHEWDSGRGFTVGGRTIELVDWNDDSSPAPTGFSGL